MQIRECMTRDVHLTSPDETIRQAAELMADLDVGALPVGEHDRLTGILTDRDIAIRIVAAGKGPDTKVREAMSHEIRYCFDDEDVEHVLETMGEQKVRRMPVLNRQKRLVGIVSLGDLALELDHPKVSQAISHLSEPGGAHSQTTH